MKKTIPILALLLMAACADDDLKKVAKSLLVTADAVGVAQTTVIDAHQLKLMNTEETRAVLEICKQVSLAGKDAVRITRDLSKLSEVERSQILTILNPVIVAVRDSQLTLNIKDPATKDKVRVLLLAIETALNSTQLIISAGR